MLLNAFYGGALTMFFTSELSIPFNNIEEVMKAYPNFVLQMMAGDDVHFQYKALQVNYDNEKVTSVPKKDFVCRLLITG